MQDQEDAKKKKPVLPPVKNPNYSFGKDYTKKIEGDKATRFQYLLSQTEIFSHFLNAAGRKPPTSPLKMKKMPDFDKAASASKSSVGE